MGCYVSRKYRVVVVKKMLPLIVLNPKH